MTGSAIGRRPCSLPICLSRFNKQFIQQTPYHAVSNPMGFIRKIDTDKTHTFIFQAYVPHIINFPNRYDKQGDGVPHRGCQDFQQEIPRPFPTAKRRISATPFSSGSAFSFQPSSVSCRQVSIPLFPKKPMVYAPTKGAESGFDHNMGQL